MWISFFTAYLVILIVLYLPGFFFFRTFFSSNILSMTFAPVFSIFGYILLTIIYTTFGIISGGSILFLPVLIVSVCFFAIKNIFRKGRYCRLVNIHFSNCDYGIVLFYVAVSVSLFLVLCIMPMGGPEGISNENDNYFHLSKVFSFVNSFQTGISDSSITITPLEYPLVWHLLVSVIVELDACSIPIGVNALNLALCSTIFPLGIFTFISLVFKNTSIRIFGAICSLAFTAFPWGFIQFGPLYPNLLGYALIPISLSILYILLFNTEKKSNIILYIGIALVSIFVMGMSHQNTIFSYAIFAISLICWKVYKVYIYPRESPTRIKLKGLLFIVVILILFVSVWVFLYKASFMQNVVQFEWTSFASKTQSAINVALVAYNIYSTSQFLLAILVLIGMFYSCVQRKYLYLVFPYLFISFLYIFGSSSDGTMRHFLTGFWYTDTWRVSGMLAIAGIPLAVMGMYCCFAGMKTLMHSVIGRAYTKVDNAIMISAIIIAFAGINFCPNYSCFKSVQEPAGIKNITPFGVVTSEISRTSDMFYESQEKTFIQEVKKIVGDSAVLNDPLDGSPFAKFVDDLLLYFGAPVRFDENTADDENSLIRAHLKDYLENNEIRTFLEENNIEYILQLDVPDLGYSLSREWDLSEPLHFDDNEFRASRSAWNGYYGIDESTPGFELVLSEGDMRLYRLTGIS